MPRGRGRIGLLHVQNTEGGGAPGTQGPQGIQGPAGTPGYTPVKGVDYFDGAQGDDGAPGTQGPQGNPGSNGTPGAKGDTGNAGAQGNPGPNQVTTSTTTNITGLIKGNGSVISQASAPSDFVATGDSRLSDARTPTTHSHSPADVTGTAVVTADSRLSDARTPTTHNQAESTLTFTDITTGDVSASSHGFTPKAPNVSTKYLAGNGTWVDLPTTGTGFTVAVQALTSSPTDGQTVYFGMLPKAPTTTAAASKIYMRKTCTLKVAEIYCYSGTAGTNESWSLYVRKNNTTDTLIATLGVSASERLFTNAALSVSLVSGDYLEIKGVQPTWATNPLTTIYGGYLYFE